MKFIIKTIYILVCIISISYSQKPPVFNHTYSTYYPTNIPNYYYNNLYYLSNYSYNPSTGNAAFLPSFCSDGTYYVAPTNTFWCASTNQQNQKVQLNEINADFTGGPLTSYQAQGTQYFFSDSAFIVLNGNAQTIYDLISKSPSSYSLNLYYANAITSIYMTNGYFAYTTLERANLAISFTSISNSQTNTQTICNTALSGNIAFSLLNSEFYVVNYQTGEGLNYATPVASNATQDVFSPWQLEGNIYKYDEETAVEILNSDGYYTVVSYNVQNTSSDQNEYEFIISSVYDSQFLVSEINASPILGASEIGFMLEDLTQVYVNIYSGTINRVFASYLPVFFQNGSIVNISTSGIFSAFNPDEDPNTIYFFPVPYTSMYRPPDDLSSIYLLKMPFTDGNCNLLYINSSQSSFSFTNLPACDYENSDQGILIKSVYYTEPYEPIILYEDTLGNYYVTSYNGMLSQFNFEGFSNQSSVDIDFEYNSGLLVAAKNNLVYAANFTINDGNISSDQSASIQVESEVYFYKALDNSFLVASINNGNTNLYRLDFFPPDNLIPFPYSPISGVVNFYSNKVQFFPLGINKAATFDGFILMLNGVCYLYNHFGTSVTNNAISIFPENINAFAVLASDGYVNTISHYYVIDWNL